MIWKEATRLNFRMNGCWMFRRLGRSYPWLDASACINLNAKKNAPYDYGAFLAIRAWRCPTFTREPALSSALNRFTVLFGMGRSGTNSLWSSGKTFALVWPPRSNQQIHRVRIRSAFQPYFECVKLGITSLIMKPLTWINSSKQPIKVIGSSRTSN